MKNFDVWNVLFYCLFSTFVYYHQAHLRNFHGASKLFKLILTIFAYSGMIVGFTFLIYYGIKVTWWAPFVMFFISVIFMFVSGLFEKLIIGALGMSLLGFIVWPVCAYLMFNSIPVN